MQKMCLTVPAPYWRLTAGGSKRKRHPVAAKTERSQADCHENVSVESTRYPRFRADRASVDEGEPFCLHKAVRHQLGGFSLQLFTTSDGATVTTSRAVVRGSRKFWFATKRLCGRYISGKVMKRINRLPAPCMCESTVGNRPQVFRWEVNALTAPSHSQTLVPFLYSNRQVAGAPFPARQRKAAQPVSWRSPAVKPSPVFRHDRSGRISSPETALGFRHP